IPGTMAHGDEWSLDVSSGFVVADLHDEPEPALPTTDGAEEDEEAQRVAQRLAAALGAPVRPQRPVSPPESAEERGRRLLAYVDAS
ncbi:hypothetical protein, partial [Klebsiella pneumoniae]|uniref:hypothetical protein n=1 Tax=Klebsiella pneumoniae TaxID=573 RepID=UPI0025A0D0F9